ncbi:hypothetical protein KY348_04635 [Candidatus Woesearchaeota archaeon]|nr:hypothetical protein [Candidatus Woesearchaeota archaeon]
MPDKDDYELLPKKDMDDLRREVKGLKKDPFGETQQGKTLVEAISELNDNINRLIDIFARTEADLAKEYSQISAGDELGVIKQQNEQLAQGIVAVADMMKEIKDMKEEEMPISPGPKIPMIRPSPSFEPGDISGMPSPAPEPSLGDVPPPPPAHIPGSPPPPMPAEPGFEKKRKGLFSRK